MQLKTNPFMEPFLYCLLIQAKIIKWTLEGVPDVKKLLKPKMAVVVTLP